MSSNAAAAAAPTLDIASAPHPDQQERAHAALLPHAPRKAHARPRILYVASTRHSGGLEVASVRLAAQLMELQPERQQIIFACRPGQYVESECACLGIPTAALTIRNSGDFGGIQRLIDIVDRERIDIIHVHSRRDYVIAALAVSRMRKDESRSSVPKLLLHLHLVRALGSPAFLSGFLFAPLVDKVLAVSHSVQRNLMRCHPQLTSEQVVIVPNAVDASKYRRDNSLRSKIRDQFGIAESTFVIGMVGRLDSKGQEQVIRALATPRLRESMAYLLLVGSEGKPGTQRRLTRIAKRLQVLDQVIFCGAQACIAPYLSAMDMLAHMPIDEAFGLAPAEAMASGLPVVASNIDGCAELIDENKTGLLAPPLKRGQIAEQIGRLIDSPALRVKLGAAGARHVKSRYNADVQFSALTGIYEEMTAARKTS